MNAEIEHVANQVLGLYERQHDYLMDKPVAVIEELRHRAEESCRSLEFSVRTAAEINRAACVMILERRAKGAR